MTEMVSLYHGTTWARAQRILEDGWQPQDVFGIVNDVAAQFGTQSSVLLEDIRKCGGYMAAEQNRGGHVSFTGSRSNAIWTWAQNAPESRREALWSVWRTQHAYDEESRLLWTKDLDGRQWVLEQLSDDRPALLTVSLTREEWVAAALYPQSVDGQLSLPAELLHALPEIQVRQPFRPRTDAVEVEELPRIVDWETFAKMLGLSHDEFVKKAEAGEFGVPGSKATPTDHPFEIAWWSLEAVDEILARRALVALGGASHRRERGRNSLREANGLVVRSSPSRAQPIPPRARRQARLRSNEAIDHYCAGDSSPVVDDRGRSGTNLGK